MPKKKNKDTKKKKINKIKFFRAQLSSSGAEALYR
jgi:hypothetical protein